MSQLFLLKIDKGEIIAAVFSGHKGGGDGREGCLVVF